ncbi:MAG: biotin/lipoyl-binding protein, partial [Methanobrevibacter sp.]|nr:biotin/lipoyl-binding protein [Methanobrevibacter sp.]
IPTEYSVEVDGDIFDVKILPTGFMKFGGNGGGEPVGPIPGALTASMQGMVLKIKVNTGDKVKEGDVVAVLEAMKMENDIYAKEDGIVKEIFVEEGDTVNAGDNLMLIKPLDE